MQIGLYVLIGLIGFTAVVVVPIYLVSEFNFIPEIAGMLAAMVVGAIVVMATYIRKASPETTGLTIFAVLLICGGVLAVVRTSGAPKMEPAAVLLKDGRWLSGFYVGQTNDRIYLAPLPGSGDPGDPFADADVDRVVEISRETGSIRLALQVAIRNQRRGRRVGTRHSRLLEDLLDTRATEPHEVRQHRRSLPSILWRPLLPLFISIRASRPGRWSADYFLRNSALVWVESVIARPYFYGAS